MYFFFNISGCECDESGTIENTFCNKTNGKCHCKDNVDKGTYKDKQCDTCKMGFWNLAKENSKGCEDCQCNSMGSKDASKCNFASGQCECKENVEGLKCDRCKPGFWNLSADNSKGCQRCNCSDKGSIDGSFCDEHSGKCQCKPNVEGDKCDRCKTNYWNLTANVNGCEECDCSTFGRKSNECDSESGTCQCHENYDGLQCYECASGYHRYPTCDTNYQPRILNNTRNCTCGKKLESTIKCKDEFISKVKRTVCEGTSLENRLRDCDTDDECPPDLEAMNGDSPCSESTCLMTLDQMLTSKQRKKECGFQFCPIKGMYILSLAC